MHEKGVYRMNTILEHQQLEIRNLISFRGKVRQEKIPAVMQKMKAMQTSRVLSRQADWSV